jgi:GTP-binding protein
VLGTIDHDEGQLVIADIPGLVEGASAGAGLGDEFLAHVERTLLLVHLVDVAPVDGSDPWKTFMAVEGELATYGAGLERRPRLVALGKADLVSEEELRAALARWRERLGGNPHVCRSGGTPLVVGVSSVSSVGIAELKGAILAHTPAVPSLQEAAEDEQVAEHVVFRPAAEQVFEVERRDQHLFRIAGPAIERLVARHDLTNQEALAYIEERLKAMGVVKELESSGFEPGDEIEIGDTAFALYPGVPQRE